MRVPLTVIAVAAVAVGVASMMSLREYVTAPAGGIQTNMSSYSIVCPKCQGTAVQGIGNGYVRCAKCNHEFDAQPHLKP